MDSPEESSLLRPTAEVTAAASLAGAPANVTTTPAAGTNASAASPASSTSTTEKLPPLREILHDKEHFQELEGLVNGDEQQDKYDPWEKSEYDFYEEVIKYYERDGKSEVKCYRKGPECDSESEAEG